MGATPTPCTGPDDGRRCVERLYKHAGLDAPIDDLDELALRLNAYCGTCVVREQGICSERLAARAPFVMIEVIADRIGVPVDKLLGKVGLHTEPGDIARELISDLVMLDSDRESPVADAFAAVVRGEATLATVSRFLEPDDLARLRELIRLASEGQHE